MTLPEFLKKAIENEALHIRPEVLLQASQQLSQRYRDHDKRQKILSNQENFVTNETQRLAYILTRMPATFGAVKYVLNELKTRLNQPIHTVLDVGSGPGTTLWAVAEIFKEANRIHLFEQDRGLITLGKKLASKNNQSLFLNAQWLQTDVLKQTTFPESDLVIVSYSMGEWPENKREEIAKKLWTSAKKAFVIIEPGTMVGFSLIRKIRQQLLDWGAFMIAPCPHQLKCPMPENDWCHFSVRIERSRLHRVIKEGSLGYEDEKFSYIAVAKSSVSLPDARILRHPLKRSGHVNCALCTKTNGLENKIISRRDGELYKKARDLKWGDFLETT